MFGVLHFRLGQGGLIVNAPMDGLLALVDHVFLDELSEFPRDRRFIGISHGQIGSLPAPENAEAFELLALNIDEAGGVLAAGLADLHGVESFLFFS